MLGLVFLLVATNSKLAFCYPLSETPIEQSSDVWATIITNIAPLMNLVGERHAKEYMRTASSWHQFVPLAAAPLGILSILVSAIRLSGSEFLRRLIGRASERRSEALVELTSLSVSPATSVFSRRAVEVQPYGDPDGVAFVCGHVPDLKPRDAIEGFWQLLHHRQRTLQRDRDQEIVLTFWGTNLSIENTARLVNEVQTTSSSSNIGACTASLSYRSTGISPTLGACSSRGSLPSAHQFRDLITGFVLLAVVIGLQYLGQQLGSASMETFWMGIAGYLGIVICSFGLLTTVKSEVQSDELSLPKAFQTAVWTFSNDRHTEHRRTNPPPANTLTTSKQREFAAKNVKRRSMVTFALAVGISGSYLLFYLSLRTAPWWVPLGILGTTWAGATYRALISHNFLVAISDELPKTEYWIGIFQENLSKSIIAMLDYKNVRSIETDNLVASSTHDTDSTNTDIQDRGFVKVEKDPVTQFTITAVEDDLNSGTALFVVPALRTSFRSWSGLQDVIKVGLEMAKRANKIRHLKLESCALASHDGWLRLVRLRMAVYVPGMVWRSHQTLDLALGTEFDLDSVTRRMMQCMQVCLDQEGELSFHDVDRNVSAKLSHVLCGPIAAQPTSRNRQAGNIGQKVTLRDVLSQLRDTETNRETQKYSLDQAVLLPTIMLASAWGRWHSSVDTTASKIEVLQNKHVDRLALSGAAHLPTMESEFDRLRLWDHFMTLRSDADIQGATGNTNDLIVPRDATSGNYVVHNIRDRLQDNIRNALPVGEDGKEM